MNSLLPLLLTLFFTSCSHSTATLLSPPASRNIAFVSKKATEAILTFSHRVEIEAPRKPTEAKAKEQIESQVLHLFGPMERLEYSAAPKEDHKIKITEIRKKADVDGVYEIFYNYKGTIVLEKGAGAPKTTYSFFLPINPDTIFEQGMVRTKNRCTDEHYQAEEDFWYFWSPAPYYPDCPLTEGEDYEVVNGSIERIDPSKKSTYPEYSRLAKDGNIDIHIFFGMDDPDRGHNPYQSADINAENYRKTKEELEKLGLVFKKWTAEEIKAIATLEEEERLPYVEEGTKVFSNKGITLRVRLFFGESGIDEDSTGFHYFFWDALANASIMIYDGHSGLGGHLDLQAIADLQGFNITPNRDRYQIYFFNSCTSYTYYNASYLQKKRKRGKKFADPKGTKNLDLLANGLSTAFDTMHNTDMALVNAVHQWLKGGQRTSYQTLAQRIDSDNLFTIIGDEDNPLR